MKQLCLIIALFLCSCSDKSTESYEIFTRENIPISVAEKKIIYDYNKLESDFNLENIFVYNDSIWIKQYFFNPLSKNIIEFVNINDSTQKRGFLTYGKGHMEMKGGYMYSNDHYLAVNDIEGNMTIALFDIDSVFYEGYKPDIIRNITLTPQIYVLENKDLLIGNDSFFEYRSCKQHYNIGSERIVRFRKNENYKNKHVEGADFIVNYGAVIVTANEQRNRIVSASRTLPEITITDTLFNIKRVLVGPDKFDLNFTNDKGRIYPNKITDSYSSLCKTDKYIYLVYEGVIAENIKDIGNYRDASCEIIKMDWDGNVKHIYKLDKMIYKISVKNDEVLIGKVYDGNNPYLVQYDISGY